MSFRRDPFESMDQMFEQMRRAMLGGPTMAAGTRGQLPQGQFEHDEPFGGGTHLRMEETDVGYVVMADLPGFEREEITVRFEDGLLTIAAESEVTDDEEFAAIRRDRTVRDELRVPGSVREDEIQATYRNGVLEITLPTEGEETADDEHVIDVR